MTQTLENKSLSLQGILKILQSEAESIPASPTSVRYLRALSSLQSSASSAHLVPLRLNTASSDSLTTYNLQLTTAITDWLVNMWLLGIPFSTASLHLDIISALYTAAVKKDLFPKTTLFSQLKATLKQLGPEGWKSGINDEIFSRALRLTKNAARLIADDAIAADLMLLSLTDSLQPLEQLALLKNDSSASSAPHAPLRDIIARHAGNARRKYLFPLNQSQRTESQLKKHVAKITNALFRRARLPQATDPNQTVRSLWAYAALRTGIPASQIVACLGQPPLGLPILRLVPHAKAQRENLESTKTCASLREISEEGGTEPAARELCSLEQDVEPSIKTFAPLREVPEAALRETGRVFLDNPARWYAMSLRPGIRFTQVCRRIQLLTSSNSNSPNLQLPTPNSPELFYPCEEIARAIGKKIVIKQRPFIHSVVFFKAKLTDIGPLFARIGDLAWCYRQSAAPGAPYAEISDTQFRQFQQTIARFTPDYEVAPAGELELKENDRVEIVGGLFAGHEATVEMVGTHGSCVRVPSGDRAAGLSSGETIYRLNIIGENGIEWRIKADSRLVRQKN